MDSVRLPTAPSSLRSQMLGQPLHHIPLPPCNRNLRLKPVIGINLSGNHVSPVAVITRDETSVAPLASPQPRLKVSPSSLQYPAGYLGAVPERASDPENGSIAEAMEYLTNILSTKVYDVAIETPLHLAKKLSERLGVRLFLKREDLQPVFSFKLRGAYNMMVKLPAEQLAKGVICSSAGNHAQGVALSAAKLGCTAVIVMPRTTPEIKVFRIMPYETTSVSPLASPQPRLKVSPSSLQYPAGYLGAVPERTSDSENGSIAEAMEYLTNILSTKVYDVAIETPLHLAEKLSERLGVRLFLKREDLQPVFSFKLRGAYNMMVKLPAEQLAKGVICSSAGNHAQGVALSAAKLGCTSVIVMPRTTPEIKWQSVENLGATVVLVGDSYDEAQAFAKQRAEEEGLTFIPPFDHPDVIAGQGTVGMEITRQAKGPLHAIFVPIGGGGLIAGIASYVKRVCPEVKIIGVEPADANTMALSLHHGERVILDQVGGFADGVAVKVVGEETFRISRKLVDGVVLVTRDAICASIKVTTLVIRFVTIAPA
ncbi:hypothetical protein F2Q70_00037555 [Brassica cretica]|uniref:Tryptophan synthase beta chain-like PALP domain-containing protein n=1 Tax=Brassica cretica TaxID=69181 RepID=A0A8S9JUX9_BRACR|nr:hypothetical protein F2Q70_00037555 [Brassica cretica]